MLVVAKSAYPDTERPEGLRNVELAKAFGGQHDVDVQQQLGLCPQTFNNKGGDYIVMLAGTNSDFCTALNANYKNNASAWP